MKRGHWLLATVLATAPVYVWMGRRMVDGSDEPWGLLAAATGIGLVVAKHKPAPPHASLVAPGIVLALYADLRFAAEDAKFTTAVAARGLVAEHGIAWLLPRLIGEAHALDLLFSARKFTGAEAEAMGLVNKALPAGSLSAHVSEVARMFAHDVSPRSVAVMKRQLRASYFQSFADSLATADAEVERSFAAPDFKEGVSSFVERRAPAFAGV